MWPAGRDDARGLERRDGDLPSVVGESSVDEDGELRGSERLGELGSELMHGQ